MERCGGVWGVPGGALGKGRGMWGEGVDPVPLALVFLNVASSLCASCLPAGTALQVQSTFGHTQEPLLTGPHGEPATQHADHGYMLFYQRQQELGPWPGAASADVHA